MNEYIVFFLLHQWLDSGTFLLLLLGMYDYFVRRRVNTLFGRYGWMSPSGWQCICIEFGPLTSAMHREQRVA
jgi:hypothetical protein